MMRCVLIRHAHTAAAGVRAAGRAEGYPLSDWGRQQAERLAPALAGEPAAAIYSSPQERARETAQAVARAANVNVQIAAALDELDYGEWTGRTFADLENCPEWRSFNALRSGTRIPGGESITEVQARIVAFMQKLAVRHAGGAVFVVSHADVIRAALAYYLGMPIDFMLRLDISPASISIVDIYAAGSAIRCINKSEPLCP